MKMQDGQLVVYSKPRQVKTLTGIQKQVLEQMEARKLWKELEKR